MTIIFSKRDDTMFLQGMWEGLEGISVIEVESEADYDRIVPALEAEKDCVMLCGHGLPSGLLAPTMCGSIVNGDHVHLLRGKTIIAIWCYASSFGSYYCLNGFFSSMFISSEQEAKAHGYKATETEIDRENAIFARRINRLLKQGVPVCEWEHAMSCYRRDYDKSGFAYFNYCGLVNLNEFDY